jgi:hypothetical protein
MAAGQGFAGLLRCKRWRGEREWSYALPLDSTRSRAGRVKPQ